MKLRIFMGIVISLVLVLTITIPAMAAKPAPVINYDSVTYDSLNGSNGVSVNGISWKNIHPKSVVVILNSTDYSSHHIQKWVSAPKGKDAKYPQGMDVFCPVPASYFGMGEHVEVSYYLITKTGTSVWGNNSQPIVTITWGTAIP